jgi:hypothetical protein
LGVSRGVIVIDVRVVVQDISQACIYLWRVDLGLVVGDLEVDRPNARW